jgi:hypothetical protein
MKNTIEDNKNSESMRDRRFVAVHRGGLLSKEDHRLFRRWAYDCAKHVLPLLENDIDERLTDALKTARAWEKPRWVMHKEPRGEHMLWQETARVL